VVAKVEKRGKCCQKVRILVEKSTKKHKNLCENASKVTIKRIKSSEKTLEKKLESDSKVA